MKLQEHENIYDSDSSDEDSDPDDITDFTEDELNDPKEDENGQDADTNDTSKDADADDTSKDGDSKSEPAEQKRSKFDFSGENATLGASGHDIEVANDGNRVEIRGDDNVITLLGQGNFIVVIGDNNQVIYKEGTNEIRMEGQGNTASCTDPDAVTSSSSGIIHIKPDNGGGGGGLVDRIRGIFGGNPPDGNGNSPNLTSLGTAPVTGAGPVTRRRGRLVAQMGDGDAPTKIPRNSQDTNDRRNLVEQQDKEYQDSLQADQEKERIKLDAEAKIKAKEEETKKLKAEALARLPAEPAEDEENIITLAFRFPNGQLVRRNFRRTDTVATVQDFVLSRDETPVPFEIIQYPNRAVGDDGKETTQLTLGEFGLNAESLHVREQTADPNGKPGDDDDDMQDSDDEDL